MVTLQNIAEQAGVSRATVSVILNNKGAELRISEKTRNKVSNLANRLGYTRNSIAHAVRTGKTKVIAFITEEMGSVEYTGRIQEGVMHEASDSGYSVKLFRIDQNEPHRVVKKMLEERIAGCLVHCANSANIKLIQREMFRHKVPMAIVNLKNSGNSGIGVTTDDYYGARQAVKHLAGLGHRRIAHVTYKGHSEYIINRRNGYVAEMGKIDGEAEPLIIAGGNKPECVRQLRTALSAGAETRPTAIFCIDDGIAMAVLRVAYQLNIKVPEELSIVGFGGLEMGEYSPVMLTTITQPFEAMGKLATSRLISEIEQENAELFHRSKNFELPTELLVRESTAAI